MRLPSVHALAVAVAIAFSYVGAARAQEPETAPAPAAAAGLGARAAMPRSARAVSVPHDQAPTATAVRIPNGAISVDGKLDEPVWMTATAITEFWQMTPDEGALVSRPTEVRILYDDEAIYIGGWLWDERGKKAPTRLQRHDVAMLDTEVFAVHLDSYHDHRTSFRVGVNPSGAKRDVILIAGKGSGPGGLGGGDVSWNPVWEGKTSVTDQGWFAEIRIPFSQLRFRREDEQVWGLQLERKLRPGQENAQWVYTPATEVGAVPRFGHLLGIRGIKSGRKLEVLPYLGGRAEYIAVPQSAAAAFANPFRSDAEYSGYGGLDLKYLITSNLTLDATANPDFGQVEVDPAVINLTAFETRFAERRPFFVEGAENFEFANGSAAQILYSRRIGRPPQGTLPSEAAYAFSPPTTTILGAGKVTGKTANGWSLAALDAVTSRERATWTGLDRTEHEQDVEPLTNYFAARARRELRAGQTMFGGLVTAVRRDLGGSALQSRLAATAYSGGIDWKHEWANRRWMVDGFFSPSRVSGSASALTAIQRTSARYYQRPDADYLEVDSTATSLFGYSARAALHKQTGGLRMDAVLSAVSPGYEVNDLGFQNIADRLGATLTLGWEQPRPGSFFRSWSVRAGPDFAWDYGGDRVGASTSVAGSFQLPDFSNVGGSFTYNASRLNTRLTRGGPLTRDPAGFTASLNYTTDNRTAFTGSLRLSASGDRSGAWERQVGVGLDYEATQTLNLGLSPTYTRAWVTAQYVSSSPDALASATFGRRYVFADLKQNTFSVDVRVNYTMTPEMSFELFAQPFVSTGDYRTLKELTTPGTFRFGRYGEELGTVATTADQKGFRVDPDGAGGPAAAFTVNNRDFNYRSLRANAVYRWEWRPGSTLYLVWQQQRQRDQDVFKVGPYDHAGEFRFGQDTVDIFRQHADNVFLIKVSYWLNP